MSKKQKVDLYRIERFAPEKLERLKNDIFDYAIAIGGMPKNHFEVLDKRGWLLPFLFGYDDLLWGRWQYWTEILQKGTIVGSGPIPRMEWSDTHAPLVESTRSMFGNCLKHHEANIDSFAEWLLWGLAATNEKPRVSEKLNEHYYREFDLFPVLDNPTDYLSLVLCNETGKGYQSGLGYYPTPFSLTQMMVELMHGDGDPEELKRQTVCDPCIGCGAMLLPASNYFLRGYGQDISRIATQLCIIQFYFYAPWYARPGHVEGFDQTSNPIQLVIKAPDTTGQLEFQLNM